MKQEISSNELISVVIPAYNEEKAIKKCLNSLVRQKTKFRFEVIVVDNNSSDNTVAVAKEFKNNLILKIVKEKIQGRGAARYAGFEAAKGTIIFTTDADTILPSDWIERYIESFQDPRVIAVTSPFKITDSRNNRILQCINMPSIELYNLFFGHYWLNGYSFAIRKDAYIASGKLNKNLNALDDFEISQRVHKLGKIKYVRDIYAVTSSRRYDQKGILRGAFCYVKPCLELKFGISRISIDDVR